MLVVDRGGPVDQAGDVNGDGVGDVIIASGIGSIRVIFGPTLGNNGVLNAVQLDGKIGFAINGRGPHVAGLGDINGDGLDDVAVGSDEATYVVFGQREDYPSVFDVNGINGRNGFTFLTPTTSVSPAGDINNDGIADMIVGNADASPNDKTSAGESYVIYGSRAAFPAQLSPQQLNGVNGFTIEGVNRGDKSGLALASAGDFNADGIDDFMLGAPFATRNGVSEAGEAYLILGQQGNFPARIQLANINGGNGFTFTGRGYEAALGVAVAGVGDINHDGLDDVSIGAPGKGPFGDPTDYPGEAYVLFGGEFPQVASIERGDINGNNGFILRGVRGGVIPVEEGQPTWGDMAGQAIDRVGDINNDGIADMVLGASQTIINPRRKGNGNTYIVYGSESAWPRQFSLADLDGNNGFRLVGIGTVDYSGFSVSQAGDFSGDGYSDIVVGASGQGNSYIFYGKNTAVPRANPPIIVFDADSFPVASTGFPAVQVNEPADDSDNTNADSGETDNGGNDADSAGDTGAAGNADNGIADNDTSNNDTSNNGATDSQSDTGNQQSGGNTGSGTTDTAGTNNESTDDSQTAGTDQPQSDGNSNNADLNDTPVRVGLGSSTGFLLLLLGSAVFYRRR